MLLPVTDCKQLASQQIYPLMPCGCDCTVSCLLFKPYSSFPGWNILGLCSTSEIMKRQMWELAAAGTINPKQKDKGTWRSAMAKIISLHNILERIVVGRESECTVYVCVCNDKKSKYHQLQWGCKSQVLVCPGGGGQGDSSCPGGSYWIVSKASGVIHIVCSLLCSSWLQYFRWRGGTGLAHLCCARFWECYFFLSCVFC